MRVITDATEPGTADFPYRVWWVPQIPGKPFLVLCRDLQTAHDLTHVLASYDAFEFENRVKPDYSNVGGISQWDPGEDEWFDRDDDEVREQLGIQWA
jgi:Superinfection exclusion gene product 17